MAVQANVLAEVACYQCRKVGHLKEAELTPHEAEWHPRAGIRLLECTYCGLPQNHAGDDMPAMET